MHLTNNCMHAPDTVQAQMPSSFLCFVSVILVTPVEASNLVDSAGQKVVALGVLFGFRQ